ncbi:hypothetical protein V565_118080 [Rhizoctonia solani 123E]|uniref:Uncharacterized protein n=1 Tax=Rhizoctonia solani 123E TaxID=1423351 RepID=A0A074RNN8_9AGAM|nr:hypothetical protein V565_118080 [Rhizoctonia solani 123E]
MSSSARSHRSSLASPASGFSILSDVSLIESIASSRRSHSTTTNSMTLPMRPPTHPEFTYTDAQVELWTSDSLFMVHEFQVNKFPALAKRVQDARQQTPSGSRLKIVSSQKSRDIRNALVVIYTCVTSRRTTPLFDPDTLVSALKIASRYKYLDLRQYVIDELEKSHNLSAIRRIQLSNRFSIPEWEISACAELCRRPQPISAEEANILGMQRFVDISRIREEEQSRSTVQLVNREVGTHELLNPDGTVLRQRFSETAEYTIRYARLPRCDCLAVRSRTTRSDESGSESQKQTREHQRVAGKQRSTPKRTETVTLVLCQIHDVAPRIAAESRALYTQRNDLVERLGQIKQAVAATKRGRPGASVEESLLGTSWIRGSA